MRRARQRQILLRGVAGAVVIGVLAAAGIAGATALRGRVAAARMAAPVREPIPTAPAVGVGDASEAGTAEPAPQGDSIGVPTGPAATMVRADERAAPVVAPRIPPGRTALSDSMVAERTGDTVRVSFDLLLKRTRRPDKFEWIMRETLPQVYGAVADSALRALPAGVVARAGDLVTELPERGVRIALADERVISVWPETRPGRDGPLVVAYRAVATR